MNSLSRNLLQEETPESTRTFQSNENSNEETKVKQKDLLFIFNQDKFEEVKALCIIW